MKKKRRRESLNELCSQKPEGVEKGGPVAAVLENCLSAMKKKKRRRESLNELCSQKPEGVVEKGGIVAAVLENCLSAMKKKKRRRESLSDGLCDPDPVAAVLENSLSAMKKKKRRRESIIDGLCAQKQEGVVEKVVPVAAVLENSLPAMKKKKRRKHAFGDVIFSRTPEGAVEKAEPVEAASEKSESAIKKKKKNRRKDAFGDGLCVRKPEGAVEKAEPVEGESERAVVTPCYAAEDSRMLMANVISNTNPSSLNKKEGHIASEICELPVSKKRGRNHPMDAGPDERKSRSSMENKDSGTSSALGLKLDGRLAGARFRDLNENLYVGCGADALAQFSKDPSLFEQYHEGFRRQTDVWPESPVDLIMVLLLRPVFSAAKVADLGCGEAKLGRTLGYDRVDSFDLIEDKARRIRKCNINEYVPLQDRSKDVVVLCLALMGQDCAGALREAWRILKPRGLLLVAEVTSRFESEQNFVSQLSKLGFKQLRFCGFGPKPGNTHFFLLPFQKCEHEPDKALVLDAKACLYKRR